MKKNYPSPLLDLQKINFLSILNRMDDGVIIADRNGVILFYNKSQAEIDGISPKEAVGSMVTDIYDLNRRTSLIMQCILYDRSIKNKTFFYRTASGRVVNSISSSYPLYTTERQINGAICFVKDYNRLQRSAPVPHKEPVSSDLANGTEYRFSAIIGSNPQLRQAITIAKKAADSGSPIMIQGETGTGKELIAQSVHNYGSRRNRKFMAVNCAAIPQYLMEGLLFGTSRGAFTGALDKPGLFEMAHGSTIFLDEVLSMPVELQAKMLRTLQTMRIRRLGSLKETRVDVKIISSVNQDPRAAIKEGKLRTDLYYRLGVVMVKLPPLRKNPETLAELTEHFIQKYNLKLGTHVKSISDEVAELFAAYHWPGNIRELEHLVERAMNMVDHEETIGIHHFGQGLDDLKQNDSMGMAPLENHPVPFLSAHGLTLPGNFSKTRKQQERSAIIAAMTQTRGNVTKAASILGISRQLLHYKLKRLDLSRIDFLKRPRARANSF